MRKNKQRFIYADVPKRAKKPLVSKRDMLKAISKMKPKKILEWIYDVTTKAIAVVVVYLLFNLGMKEVIAGRITEPMYTFPLFMEAMMSSILFLLIYSIAIYFTKKWLFTQNFRRKFCHYRESIIHANTR